MQGEKNPVSQMRGHMEIGSVNLWPLEAPGHRRKGRDIPKVDHVGGVLQHRRRHHFFWKPQAAIAIRSPACWAEQLNRDKTTAGARQHEEGIILS